eukprot:jgi/Mesvir1/18106/Mv09403-RA.1
MAEPGAEEGSRRDVKEDAAAALLRSNTLLQAAEMHARRVIAEEDKLAKDVTNISAQIARVRSDLRVQKKQGRLTAEGAEQMEKDLQAAEQNLNKNVLRAVMPPKPNGLFLSLFIGKWTNVTQRRVEMGFKLREEYNDHRDTSTSVFLIFPLALLVAMKYWPPCIPSMPIILYQCWLLYFYTSLAIRENILINNGSNIRKWWIVHHYCSIATALVVLTVQIDGDNCEHKQRLVRRFLYWTLMQAVVMLFQNRYQRRRMYTRIALGKASSMDVVGGESSSMSAELWLLYPLLFAMQGTQVILGIDVVRFITDVNYWQLALVGLLFLVMAVCNIWTTATTLAHKLQRMRNRPGKQHNKSE